MSTRRANENSLRNIVMDLRLQCRLIEQNVEREGKSADLAREHLKSLVYATELSKDEVARRKRGNSELEDAYTSTPYVEVSVEDVQRLETTLLSAKRELADIRYDIENMEFTLRRLRDASKPLSSSRSPRDTPESQNDSALSQLRALRSPGHLQTRSPVRYSRLIADVDAVVAVVGNANNEEEVLYAPCRIGISASGSIALFTYNSSDPILKLHAPYEVRKNELTTNDHLALREFLYSCSVQSPEVNRKLMLCGLQEAIMGTSRIIEGTSSALRIDNND